MNGASGRSLLAPKLRLQLQRDGTGKLPYTGEGEREEIKNSSF
jgi:hypothetical protein